MAIVKMAPAAQTVAAIVRYVARIDKTDSLLMDGLNVTPVPDLAVQEMMACKDYYGNTTGKQYHHVVISYHRDEHITPEQAAQNALELARETPKWQQHQILLATHTDRDHIHTHLIINSTNMATGRKLRWLRRDLADLKDCCVAMCLQQGLHVPVKGLTFEGQERTSIVADNPRTYNQLRKDAGYVHDIMAAIQDVRKTAASREDYIAQLSDKGIGVTWTDTRRNITYIDLARQAAGSKTCKVKDIKMTKYYNIDVSKDALEADFARNRQMTVGQAVTMLSALQRQLEAQQTYNRRYIRLYNSIFGNRDKTINLMKDFASGCIYKQKAKLNQQIETLKAQQKELFAKHHMTDKLVDALKTLEKKEIKQTEKLKEVQRQIDNYKELGPRNKRRLQYAIDRANRTQPVMYNKALDAENDNKTIKAQMESVQSLLGAFVSTPKEQVLTMGLAEMINEVVKNPSSNTLDGAKIMTAAREIKPVPARQQQQYAQKAQKSKPRSRGDDWSR